jgi:hypothetical protein
MFGRQVLAAAGLLALSLVAALIIAAVGPGAEKDLAREAFQKPHGSRIELPKGSQSIRVVELYPDRRTRKHGVEDHPDGSTSHYWYRPDATLERAVTYASASAEGERTVLRLARMEPDGVTFTEELGYYLDGTLERHVILQEDGTTSRRYYHSNSQIARDQVLRRDGKEWRLAFEAAFRLDGTRERSFLITAGVSTVDTLFNEKERVVVVKTHDHKRETYAEAWYQDDGTTVKREVKQDYQGTTVVVFRDNGTALHRLVWHGNVKDGYLTVSVLNLAGKKVMDQTYYYHEGQQRLKSVELFGADEKRHRLIVFHSALSPLTVEFDVVFKTPVTGYGWQGPHHRRDYRKDGTLETEKENADSSTLVWERKFAVSDNVRPVVDPSWIKWRLPDDLPPQVIEYIPESD